MAVQMQNILLVLLIAVVVFSSEVTGEGHTSGSSSGSGSASASASGSGILPSGSGSESGSGSGSGEGSGEVLPIFDDCVEAHKTTCNKDNLGQTYLIKARTERGFEPAECNTDDDGAPGCPGLGWTQVGKVHGTDNHDNSAYGSQIWTARGEGQETFNSQFWSANVTAVCLWSETFVMSFPVFAPSLRSLFFEKHILNTPPQAWLDSLKDDDVVPTFKPGCFEAGFNVGDTVRARVGIASVHKEGCDVKKEAIGVGIQSGDPGSLHGVYTEDNLENAYDDVTIYVRSRLTEPAVPPS